MTDDMIEAVARAIECERATIERDILDLNVQQAASMALARAAIRAAAPLILDMAAEALKADANLCDCFAREEGECACGAWDDYKTAPVENMVAIVRQLKKRFQ